MTKLEKAEHEAAYFREQAGLLQSSGEKLSGFHTPLVKPDTLPENYEAIPAWVEQCFSGKLILHPRAVRALEDAAYHSVELVCRALLPLSNEYHDQQTEKTTNFDSACQQLGLKFSRTKMRGKDGREDYFVPYPPDGKLLRFLDWKLERGADNDRLYCLRIYFFYNADSSMVIVGHLPDRIKER